MPMIRTDHVGTDVKTLHETLEAKYPTISPRQANRLSVHTPVRRLADRESAIAHAKWIACGVMQDVTDNCLTSAASGLLWLHEFVELNCIDLTAIPHVLPVVAEADAFGTR